MIGGLLRILVVALVVLVAAMMMLRPGGSIRSVETATVLDAPRPLPEVALTRDNGSPFSPRELEGRYSLVFFGFTNCPDICPLALAQIAEAVRQLRVNAPDRIPQVLFVSVDAARDTPARIRTYLDNFDSEFIGVTADDATLAPLLAALGVSVHKQKEGDDVYNVVHNGTIYVLDDDANWIALFGGSEHLAASIVNDYLALESQRSRG